MSAAAEDTEDDALFDQIERAVSAYTRTPVAHRRRRAYGDAGEVGRDIADTGGGGHALPTQDAGSPRREKATETQSDTERHRAARKRAAHGEPHERRQPDRPTSRRPSVKPPIPRQGRLGDTGDARTKAEAATREHRERTRVLARKMALRYGRSAEGLQAAAELLRTESAQDALDAADASGSSQRAVAPATHDPVAHAPAAESGHGSPHRPTAQGETAINEVAMHTSTDAEDGGETAVVPSHVSPIQRVLSPAQSRTLSTVLLQRQELSDRARPAEEVPATATGAAECAQQIRAVRKGAWEPDPRHTHRGPGAKREAERETQRETKREAEAADVNVDGGMGSYYRFSVVASVDIAAGAELFTDYRLAPWFVQQPIDKWRCPGAERVDGHVVLGAGERLDLHLLPWEESQ